MKKIFIYVFVSIFISMHLQGQNALASENAQLKKSTKRVNDQGILQHKNQTDAAPLNRDAFYARAGNSRAGGDFIGNTSYDLPTNGTPANWILVYGDGTISAVFTGSFLTNEERADRGTFYNHYDGSSWEEPPVERVESYRSGFPAIIHTGDHEMFFSHDGNNNISIFENEAPGSNVWTANSNSLAIKGTWPRAACAPGSAYIHLLVANDDDLNQNDYMIYYRSPDGGATWDIQGLRLPGIDTASGYNIMGAECYTLRAIGSDVYITAGSSFNDLAVWKSTSNGDIGSWTRTRLMEWPLPNFDGNEISDITGDGVADTITTHDGAFTMAIDDAGMMHVWSGVTYILDIAAGDDAWTYFPGVAGMWYWNESFGADSVQYLDFPLVDWNDDGDAFAGIGQDLPNYGVGFTSQPSVALDEATGTMYILYTQPVEYTDYYENPDDASAQSFRDIFGFYTTDKGASWSAPINMSYLAEDYYENVNPTAYWNTMDDKVHVIWMQDDDPGNSLDTETPDDATTENNIIYRGYDYSRFEPYDPTAEFADAITTNTVMFNNMSADASSYLWDFGDDDLSNLINPTHIYEATGDYTVCLTATNKYGDNQTCKTVSITEFTNISDVNFSNSVNVYPSITKDLLTIKCNNADQQMTAAIFNLQGEKILENDLTGIASLDVSKFAAGEYIVKISSDKATAVKRITILQ